MLDMSFEQHFIDVAAAQGHYVKFNEVSYCYKTPSYPHLNVTLHIHNFLWGGMHTSNMFNSPLSSSRSWSALPTSLQESNCQARLVVNLIHFKFDRQLRHPNCTYHYRLNLCSASLVRRQRWWCKGLQYWLQCALIRWQLWLLALPSHCVQPIVPAVNCKYPCKMFNLSTLF